MLVLRMRLTLAATLLLATAASAAPPALKSPDEVLKASPKSDWHRLDPAELMVMELKNGRVVIALAPGFAPRTVANIQKLVRDGYFSKGAAIIRSQDNYVVQWARDPEPKSTGGWAEFERDVSPGFHALKDPDTYAPQAGFDGDFPAASDGRREWLVHCYGMVGAGRDLAPATGDGAELYAVTGQAPRHLDRNITMVGRVVQGMELLSSLPRGSAPMGFYAKPAQHVTILSVAMANALPPNAQPRLEALTTASNSFAAYAEARRNRGGPFFVRPAGRVDVCNIPLPVRPLSP
jgi:peptidylprolyl isomerase